MGCLVPLTVLAKRIASGSRFALVLRYVATWCALGLVVVDAFVCRLIGLVDRVKRVYFCHLEALPSIAGLWLDLASQPSGSYGTKTEAAFTGPRLTIGAADQFANLRKAKHGHESLEAIYFRTFAPGRCRRFLQREGG